MMKIYENSKTIEIAIFMMAIFAFIYDITGVWYDIVTFIVAATIAGIGGWLAFNRFQAVMNNFEYGWSQLADSTAHSDLESR